MNVGVRHNGRVFVVEFEFKDESQMVDVVGIDEAFPNGSYKEVDVESDDGQRLASDQQFKASTLCAIADWNPGDSFKREDFFGKLN